MVADTLIHICMAMEFFIFSFLHSFVHDDGSFSAGFKAHKTSVVGLAACIKPGMVSVFGGFFCIMGWKSSNSEDGGAFGSMVTIYDDLEIPQAST